MIFLPSFALVVIDDVLSSFVLCTREEEEEEEERTKLANLELYIASRYRYASYNYKAAKMRMHIIHFALMFILIS